MTPEWIGRGKTVAQLIEELRSFEDQSLEVRISIDGGESSQLISLVRKRGGYACEWLWRDRDPDDCAGAYRRST